MERAALDRCRGRVLDVGAGGGAHALPLQERGLDVTAVDPLPSAVALMRRRGVHDARLGGWEALGPTDRYDTVLVLMNGVGLAGTLDALPAFLARCARPLGEGGCVLVDSTDPAGWPDPGDGREPGETHLQLELDGERGPPFPWLYAAPGRVADAAAGVGLELRVVLEDGPAWLGELQRG